MKIKVFTISIVQFDNFYRVAYYVGVIPIICSIFYFKLYKSGQLLDDNYITIN
jgi:hypothetical protein